MSVCDAEILKIMYKAEKTGNTITINKVRHRIDNINRHEIIHI